MESGTIKNACAYLISINNTGQYTKEVGHKIYLIYRHSFVTKRDYMYFRLPM